MQDKPNLATWLGAVLGVLTALLLNASFAHAARGDWIREEFHHRYALMAGGRVSLDTINGATHISARDRNQVKVDAVKRADDEEGLKNMEIRVNARPDSVSIATKYRSPENLYNNHHSSSVDYTITVPRNARLDEIQLINGALDVTGVVGEVQRQAHCRRVDPRSQAVDGKRQARG